MTKHPSTGRSITKKYDFIFNVFIKFFNIFPYSIRKFIFTWLRNIPGTLGIALRYILIKSLCKNSGTNIYTGVNVTIKHFNSLELGSNISIHENCFIDAIGGIVVGDDVSIAHNSSLISFEHSWQNLEVPIKYNPVKLGKILIENDVWIGCGVRILSGTSIRERTVIAAGSIVKGDFTPKVLIAGIPGKVKKSI